MTTTMAEGYGVTETRTPESPCLFRVHVAADTRPRGLAETSQEPDSARQQGSAGPPGPPILTSRQPSNLRLRIPAPLGLQAGGKVPPEREHPPFPASLLPSCLPRSPPLPAEPSFTSRSCPSGPSLLPCPTPPLPLYRPNRATLAASTLPGSCPGSGPHLGPAHS